jgi:hypothetical protein
MMETCLSRVTGSSPGLALVRIIPFDLIFLLVSFFGWRGLPVPMSWLYGRMAAFMCWS